MKKQKIGIMGGAGYTGGELVRLLLQHEAVDVLAVQSRSQAGRSLSSVHTDLVGETDLTFAESILPDLLELDALFMALPHGESRQFLTAHTVPDRLKIIDLSQDFRLSHQSKCGPRDFIYGLPELNREKIAKTNSVANPGCFATAIELALLPLASHQSLKSASVTGITGSTGAGVKPSSSTHFSFRANNIQAYKTLTHQHIPEVLEILFQASGLTTPEIAFIPWRGDFTRGIFISCLVESDLKLSEAIALYQKTYATHPFVYLTGDALDLKSVVNTNRAAIEINQEGKHLVIHTVIDNLLKGASGQAVQNFNLMSKLPETMGLRLKGSAF